MTTVTVLYVPDCPNVSTVKERLDLVLADRDDVRVELRLIDTQVAADDAGMAGSPTVLVDGVDEFAEPGQSPSVSCRIYRDGAGRMSGAPSVDQLREVLARDLPIGGIHPSEPAPTAVPGECCVPASQDSRGLTNALESRAVSDPAERAVHQAILSAFAATGQPPSIAALDPIAAAHGAGATDVLSRLQAIDVIGLDAVGRVAFAYPFSTTPTPHQVVLADGVTAWSMCAVDALGLPAMLGCDAVVTSADPVTGEPVTITVHGGEYAWAPPTAVVFVSASAGDGPLAETCCGDLNFFTSIGTANTWMTVNPQVPGQILGPEEAAELGRALFGELLVNP